MSICMHMYIHFVCVYACVCVYIYIHMKKYLHNPHWHFWCFVWGCSIRTIHGNPGPYEPSSKILPNSIPATTVQETVGFYWLNATGLLGDFSICCMLNFPLTRQINKTIWVLGHCSPNEWTHGKLSYDEEKVHQRCPTLWELPFFHTE